MAGPYGIDDGDLSYDGSSIKAYVTKTYPAVDQQNETEDQTPLGSSIAQSMFTGLTDYGEIPVSGPYDETIDAAIGAAARAKSTAALIVTWGGTKTTTFSVVGVKNYKRVIAKGAVTAYEATFFAGPACTVTEA